MASTRSALFLAAFAALCSIAGVGARADVTLRQTTSGKVVGINGEAPSVTYGADGGNVRDTGGGANANGDGQNVVYGDIDGGNAEPVYVDANGGRDAASTESAPAPEPAPAPAPVTETTYDETGTVSTTTTINGVQMEDGNATEYGNAQGRGASAAPGEVTYGN